MRFPNNSRVFVPVTLLASLFLFACGERAVPEGSEPAFSQRFLGLWSVQRSDAHPTVIEFKVDGQIAIPTQSCAATAQGCSLGISFQSDVIQKRYKFLPPSYWVDCVMQDQQDWRSVGDSQLVIAAVCSDKTTRDLVFQFPGDMSLNASASGADAVLLSVGELGGEQFAQVSWSFHKCDTAQACSHSMSH